MPPDVGGGISAACGFVNEPTEDTVNGAEALTERQLTRVGVIYIMCTNPRLGFSLSHDARI